MIANSDCHFNIVKVIIYTAMLKAIPSKFGIDIDNLDDFINKLGKLRIDRDETTTAIRRLIK